METSGKVALFGATGAAGASIGAALRAAGRPRRMIARSRAQLETAFAQDPDAELVTWNPDDPASIVAAASGVETAVYLVGVPYDRFELHPELMQKTLTGLIAAGVRQLILIGTVYPYGRARTNPVTEAHPREPHTFKGRMRLEQENLVLAAHGHDELSTLVLRLPDFYGPGIERSLVHGLFTAAAAGGRAQMIGPIDVPHEFVFMPDVGPVVEALTRTSSAFGRVLHLGGAGVITQREMASRAFALADRPPKLMVAGKPMLRALGLFNPLMRELVEMHYLITEPLILDDSALHGLLGPIRKTPYDEGIRQTLYAAREAFARSHPQARVAA